MFGSVRAQTELERAISFWSEIARLELALDLGSESAGVHSADELAEGGRRRGRGGGCGEGVRAGVTLSKSRGPHLAGNKLILQCYLLTLIQGCQKNDATLQHLRKVRKLQ